MAFKPNLVLIVTEPCDRMDYLVGLFCAKAAQNYDDISLKATDLNIVLDDIERLPLEFDDAFDARKALDKGLKTCWQNLPKEKDIYNDVKSRIMHTAALACVALTR